MDYSLSALNKLFPELQLVGGHFVVRHEGKNVHIGTYVSGGSVVLTPEGEACVAGMEVSKPKPERMKKLGGRLTSPLDAYEVDHQVAE